MFGSLRKSCVLAGRNLLPDLVKGSVKLTGVSTKNRTFRANRISSGCQHFFHTTAQTNEKSASKPSYVATKEDKQQFEALFNDLLKNLTLDIHQDIADTNKHFANVLNYNVPGGKNLRGMAVYNSYRMLVPESQITKECKQLVMTMGWCIEMLQAFILVLDDIMDEADQRRGKPCWYHVENFGSFAINDGILLECAVYEILHRYFHDKSYFVDVLDLFHTATLKTMMGQSIDTLSCKTGKENLENFTMELYTTIVKYKTGYYSCYFPNALAMHMAGIKDQELFRQAESIFLDMGLFFQIQDDFLDVFGVSETTGKTGTDIQAGKCSWLAVVALERANPEQRRIMDECYGSSDPKKVEAVRQLYETLDLRSIYEAEEKKMYNNIKTNIQKASCDLPAEMFLGMLNTFYKRVL